MQELFKAGKYLFAFSIIAFGIIQFGVQEFMKGFLPMPDSLPARDFFLNFISTSIRCRRHCHVHPENQVSRGAAGRASCFLFFLYIRICSCSCLIFIIQIHGPLPPRIWQWPPVHSSSRVTPKIQPCLRANPPSPVTAGYYLPSR